MNEKGLLLLSKLNCTRTGLLPGLSYHVRVQSAIIALAFAFAIAFVFGYINSHTCTSHSLSLVHIKYSPPKYGLAWQAFHGNQYRESGTEQEWRRRRPRVRCTARHITHMQYAVRAYARRGPGNLCDNVGRWQKGIHGRHGRQAGISVSALVSYGRTYFASLMRRMAQLSSARPGPAGLTLYVFPICFGLKTIRLETFQDSYLSCHSREQLFIWQKDKHSEFLQASINPCRDARKKFEVLSLCVRNCTVAAV